MKSLFAMPALAALVMACSQPMFAQVDEQLILTVGSITATAQLTTGGVLSTTCTGTGANATTCGDFWTASQTPVGTKLILGGDGGTIKDTGQDGTLSLTGVTFNGFSISDTAVGGVASLPLPALMNQNETDATTSGAGTLTVNFTDIDYTSLTPLIQLQDSETTSAGIPTSPITWTAYDSATSQIGTGTELGTGNTLMGLSDSDTLSPVANTVTSGSITTQAVLGFKGSGTIQTSISVSEVTVPEPASIVLLGTMILGLTALIRKKQEKRA